MSLRRASMSSSGPMQIDSIASCGPTTCSIAVTNSAASRPWVTSTNPIIDSTRLSLVGRAAVCVRSIASLGGEARSRCRTFGENPDARNRSAISTGDGDRTVPPASASECDGHIIFAGGPVARNPVVEKRKRCARSSRPTPGRRRDSRALRHLRRSVARSSSTQCGLGRKRTSNTRSAVREMPRAKPNEAMVRTGWSPRRRKRRRSSSRDVGGAEVGGVEHAVGGVAERARSARARARCRPRPGGRARAGAGAGSRRSGGCSSLPAQSR